MKTLLLIAVGVLVGIPCIWGFARWERQGKALRAVVLILVLMLLEAALYENQDTIPRGIFHPGSGSTQLRLPEILITLALLGRLVARRLPQRIGYPAMLWAAFAAWLVLETVEGYLRHNNHSQVLFEAKAIVYVAGALALAAGVPAREYIDARVFARLARWFGPVALFLDIESARHKTYVVHLPLLRLPDFGAVGADAATMFVVVGLIALMLELGSTKPNLWTILTTVPLLLSVVFAGQRAALLGLGASVAFLLITLGTMARRRLRVHFTELILAVGAVVAVTLAVILVPVALDQRAPKIPFSSTINTEHNSTGKAQSAQDRINELAAARHLIPQHFILGSGLGIEYNYWAPGPDTEVTSALTEDIYTDLWLRTGLIGLGFFILAALASLGGGLRTWSRHSDRLAAIFALVLSAAVFGILVKGGFESIFEKYRIATTLGLLLGMLRSIVTSARSPRPSLPDLLDGRILNERA